MNILFYQTPSGRSPVEDFIEGLPWDDQTRFTAIYEGILEHGFECQRVTFKQLDGKLWEIKFKVKSGGYRIGYVLSSGDTMVWLHAFKKTTQKTPTEDLELAFKRMKEVLS